MKNEFYRLEDRILFEAAAEAVQSAEFAETDDHTCSEPIEPVASVDPQSVASDSPSGMIESSPDESGVPTGPVFSDMFENEKAFIGALVHDGGSTISVGRELVIINSSVKDAQTILDALNPNQDVLILENDGDPMRQILAYLEAEGGEYAAIHIVSHGNSGYFVLSGELIELDSLDRDAWAAVGEYLSDGGDLLLYGCNLAENEAGRELVAAIVEATGAEVAASTDTTGFGGNWELEFQYGSIETVAITVDGYYYRLNDWLVTYSTDNAYATGGEGTGSGDCDLRFAINQAMDGDSITFDVASNVVTLQAEIEINKDIIITGADVSGKYTTIRVATLYTESPSAASDYRLFHVKGAKVEISNLILAGGSVAGNGGLILVENAGQNSAGLTLNEVLLTGARADRGGAIYSTGAKLIIDGCTFSMNTSSGSGGAVYVYNSETHINNCTFYRNNVTANASSTGVLHIESNIAGAAVLNSTFYDNHVSGNGGALYYFGSMDPPIIIINSILVGNTAKGVESNLSVSGMRLIASAYGAETDVAGRFNVDCVLLTPSEIFADGAALSVTGNPGTIAIRPDGAAAWKGALIAWEQTGGITSYLYARNGYWYDTSGYTRYEFQPSYTRYGLPSNYTLYLDSGNGLPRNGAVSAFSMGAHALPVVSKSGLEVTVAIDWVNPYDVRVSLREAVMYYAVDGDTITFDPSIFNSANDEAAKTIVFDRNYINPKISVTIRGNGENSVILDGDGKFRMFQLNHTGKSYSLSWLTFRNGFDIRYAGAVENWRCTLTIDNCIFYDNFCTSSVGYITNGGAIYVGQEAAYTEIRNSTFFNNYAYQGGAISVVAGGTCVVVNSTLTGNHADTNGGGIRNFGTLTLINSVVTGNYEGISPLTGASDLYNAGTASLAYSVYGVLRGDAVTMTSSESRTVADAFHAEWRLNDTWELVNIDSSQAIFDSATGRVALNRLGRTAIAGTLTGKAGSDYYFLDGNVWRSFTSASEFTFNSADPAYGLTGGDVFTTAMNGVSRVLTLAAFNPGAYALTPETGNTVTVSTPMDFSSPFFNTIYDAVAYARFIGQYIDFAPGITHIELNGGPLMIDYNLEIRGAAAGSVTLSANSPDDSIFHVTGGLTLLDGLVLGAGIITGTGNIDVQSSLAGSMATVDMTGGTVSYSGSAQKVLGGTYYNLILGGATSGGGKVAKELAGNIGVNGTFSLTGVVNADYIELNGNGYTVNLTSYGTASAVYANIAYADILNTVFGSTLHLNATNTAADSNVRIYITAQDLTASALTYGDTLADSAVTGSAIARGQYINGVFLFRDGDTMPQVSDSNRTRFAVFLDGNPIYVVTGTATVEVAARQITVRADDQTRVYGDADPKLTWTIIDGELVGADRISGSLTYTGINVGEYAIVEGTLLSAGGNYRIVFVAGNMTITRRSITIHADPQGKEQGDPDPRLTWQMTEGTLAYHDRVTGEMTRRPGEAAGEYAILQGTLAVDDNYDITFIGNTFKISGGPTPPPPEDRPLYNYDRTPRWDNENYTVLALTVERDYANALTRYRMPDQPVEVSRRVIDAFDLDDIGISSQEIDFFDGFDREDWFDLPGVLQPELQKAHQFLNVFDTALSEVLSGI